MIARVPMRLSIVVLALTAALPNLAGCNHPQAAEAHAYRWQRAQTGWQQFVDRERKGSARLADTGERIESERRYRRERFAESIENFHRWNEDQERRWRERQPEYRAALRRTWRGDPEHAWETVPRLLY